MACIDQELTDRHAVYNGDSCEILPTLADGSVHLSIYSPPFAGLWVYSSSERDLSNARTYEEFLLHYEFIVREITRLTMTGRITAVHCMDVPTDGANICGYTDFPGDIIRMHQRLGWEMLPRISIWKEPLEVRNRTMLKSLAHRQIVEDSTLTNVAAADYLIPFRKKGPNPVPVAHPTGLDRYVGSREIPSELHSFRNWPGNQIENRYSHWIWRNYASCFWDDIRLGRVLPYREARDPEDEKHMHPLQLDVIERACVLWSNPGEVVLTPFMGVGSEVYGAVLNGRKAIGIELKPTYYRQALANLREIGDGSAKPAPSGSQRSILDLLDDPAPVVPNPSLAPDRTLAPLPGQTSFLSDEPAPAPTLDPWPPGSNVFACNRCHARRSAATGHPCPACGCVEFAAYRIPEDGGNGTSGVPATSGAMPAGAIIPDPEPEPGPAPDPLEASFRQAVEGVPWAKAWDNLVALGVDQDRYGEYLVAWREGWAAVFLLQCQATWAATRDEPVPAPRAKRKVVAK